MARLVSFIASILFCATLFAQSDQTFQIKNLNTQTIEIGGKRLKVGDRFNDSEKIKWTSDGQVMEAVDSKNHEIHVFSATALKSKKADNVAAYLVNINHASTRDVNSLNWTLTKSDNSDKFSDRRVALLIANTNYFHISKLRNPMYDCNALSNKLLELGFDVYTAYDCDRSQLRDVVVNFSKAADSYNLALFFYSGHGVQEDGQNYLIPVNLRLDDVSELYDCVNCEFVRNQLKKSKCSNRIILFDACRAPRTWSRDVSSVWGQMEGSIGTYISFSTKSGKTAADGITGENSPYTTALLNCIATPNRELTQVMGDVIRQTAKITNNQQEPTGSGNFCEDIYLTTELISKVNITTDRKLMNGEDDNTSENPAYENQSANEKEASSYYDIGLAYEKGEVVPQDYQKAFANYLLAAGKGLADAQFKVGYYYHIGRGISKSHQKAVEWYRMAADQGHSNAQYNLGYCYYDGDGVTQDYEKAVEWYRKAADQDFELAQFNLGCCYYKGEGVLKDYANAVNWYRKAAEHGYSHAQHNLGICYQTGQGVQQNYIKAFEWYQKAAEQGYADSQYNLGCYYYYGYAVTQDYVKAFEWYQKAAEQGYDRAQNNLGVCYANGQGVQQNYIKAFEWYQKAAEQGYADSQFNLGCYYSLGQGVSQDYTKAFEWYQKAADQGSLKAQNSLGVCYELGKGVSQNYTLAVEWYRKAAGQGHETAKENLKRLGEL
jgi:hypothetical protein